MTARAALRVLLIVLAVLVGTTGVTSAVMRTPDRAALALEAFERATGLTAGLASGGICGTDPAKAAQCPLCHGLPESAQPCFAPISLRMVPQDDWAQMRALRRAAQARNINHSPRAPPVSA